MDKKTYKMFEAIEALYIKSDSDYWVSEKK